MRVGFTGTRQGMTAQQKASLRQLLIDFMAVAFSHGDCIGADAEAHDIALELGLPIYIYPPKDDRYRAFCKGAQSVAEPKGYLERDRDIVDRNEIVIGASISPKRLEEKSGTWYTLDYGVMRRKPTYPIWPNGTVSLLLPRR